MSPMKGLLEGFGEITRGNLIGGISTEEMDGGRFPLLPKNAFIEMA